MEKSTKQTFLGENKVKYSYGSYNTFNQKEQWIRITEGCPNNCPFCYEPLEFKIFTIPEIVRNTVKIMDMNLIAKKEAVDIIKDLGRRRVNNHVVYYELICGVDYRFMTQDMANLLKENRFRNIRMAWDFSYKLQYKIKDCIQMFVKVDYQPKDIMVFMICNWRIPYSENLLKLDNCKVWNVQVGDCYYDNQTSPHIIPIHWTGIQIRDFRRKCRRHNLLVNFGIDPSNKYKS